jgi:hypothetical protein
MCLNEVISVSELKTLTQTVSARREALQAKLDSLEAPGELVAHPGAAKAYARLAERLHQVMMEGSEGEAVRAELRKLIERVDF